MGIEKLNTFLKEYSPKSYRELCMSQFSDRRIAIDAGILIYATFSMAQKEAMKEVDLRKDPLANQNNKDRLEIWFDIILKYINSFLIYRITPIIVFDGEHIPEKIGTQKKRRKPIENRIEKIAKLEKKLNKMELLERPDDLLAELLILKSGNFYADPSTIISLRKLLESLGIPCIRAHGEAEKLCVMMAIEGYVSAVYSTDTDCIAMGCPVLLTAKSGGRFPYGKFEAVIFKDVLKNIDMTQQQFLDLCIMSGCDFNTNIPGIAIKTAYKLLKLNESIEELEDTHDIKCLNHKKCRKIFKFQPSIKCLHIEHENIMPGLDGVHQRNVDKKKKRYREKLSDIDIENSCSTIMRSVEKLFPGKMDKIYRGGVRIYTTSNGTQIKVKTNYSGFREKTPKREKIIPNKPSIFLE